MSSYDERYDVHYNYVSFYTSDPAKALELVRRDPENGWVNEGYGDHRDMGDGRTMVTRRTIGKVLPSTLEFLVVRKQVQDMLARMTA